MCHRVALFAREKAHISACVGEFEIDPRSDEGLLFRGDDLEVGQFLKRIL
jgi:hypothetical protein